MPGPQISMPAAGPHDSDQEEWLTGGKLCGGQITNNEFSRIRLLSGGIQLLWREFGSFRDVV